MLVVGVTCNDGTGWTKTHAAPAFELSLGPPTMAVLPSADSATEAPWLAFSNRAGADQFAALLGPDAAAAGKDPRRSDVRVVVYSRPRWLCCRRRTARRTRLDRRRWPVAAGADQLAALLGPDAAAAREDPRRPDDCELSHGPPTMAVLPSADSATEEPCWRPVQRRRCRPACSLLGPDAAAAGEDPRRPDIRVVG